MRTERISSLIDFYEAIPFLAKAFSASPKKDEHHPTVADSINMVKGKLYEEKFLVLVQYNGKAEPKALVLASVGVDLVGRKIGHCHYLYAEPGSRSRELVQQMEEWMRLFGAKYYMAIDSVQTKLKERWLKSFGLHIGSKVWVKEI